MTNQNLPCPPENMKECPVCRSLIYDTTEKQLAELNLKLIEFRKDLDDEINTNSGTIFSDGLKLAKESFIMIFGSEEV